MSRRLFLLGPTASGKTGLGVGLARQLEGEVLSLDSMLVYRGMDLGTAKPTETERGGVPHHLIDCVAPSESYSVARYVAAAAAAEAEVRARGRLPIYVGGTTMWFKAVVHGLLETPEIPTEVRADLDEQIDREGGLDELLQELQEVDPAAAERIHPSDRRRVLRALEVWRATGRPLTEWQQEWGRAEQIGEPTVVLRWPRPELHARIEQRFEIMLKAGLLEEIRAIQVGGGFSPTARKAIGYRHLLDYLDGKCSLQEAVTVAVRATKVLVRRQTTWLRSFPDVRWLDVSAAEEPESVLRRALAEFGADAEPGA